MNRRAFMILGALPLAAVVAAQGKSSRSVVVFSVDLHCDDCVKKVMKNIAYEKGVVDIKTDMKKNEVAVTYRADRTNVDKLQAAFKKIGKEAKVVSPSVK